MLFIPSDDPPDPDHGGHGPQNDGPGEEEVGAREGVQGGVIHQGVQGPGEERGQGRDEGQGGEDPTNLGQANTLAETRYSRM